MPNRKLTVVVSYSELTTFRSCRRKWGYRYVDLLHSTSGSAARWGTIAHEAIAGAYRAVGALQGDAALAAAKVGASTAAQQASSAACAELHVASVRGELPAESVPEAQGAVIVAELEAVWSVHHMLDVTLLLDLASMRLIGVELPYEVPIKTRAGHFAHARNTGVIDAVWWDETANQVVIDDHKTVAGDPLSDGIDRRVLLDPQMSGYLAAVRHLARAGKLSRLDGGLLPRDVQVSGLSRYNVLRRSVPREPAVNKDGSVSVAAIDTTAELYQAALDEQVQRGIEISDKQRALVERLALQGDRYFRRVEFLRSLEDEALWRDEALVDAELMRLALRDPAYRTRNPAECSSPASFACSYSQICRSDSLMARAKFRVGEAKHEEVRNARRAR